MSYKIKFILGTVLSLVIATSILIGLYFVLKVTWGITTTDYYLALGGVLSTIWAAITGSVTSLTHKDVSEVPGLVPLGVLTILFIVVCFFFSWSWGIAILILTPLVLFTTAIRGGELKGKTYYEENYTSAGT